jgi:hypothetical protein
MFANVVITTQDVPDAVVVPTGAVVQQQNGQDAVYVVQDNKAQMVPIKTGIVTDAMTQIVSGIIPGAAIVTTGQNTLRPGEAVRVVSGAGAPGAAGGRSGAPGASGTPGAGGTRSGGGTPRASGTPGAAGAGGGRPGAAGAGGASTGPGNNGQGGAAGRQSRGTATATP